MSAKTDREICEAATQGPWGASVITETDGKWYFVLAKNRMVVGDADKENDAQYIAHFNPSKVIEMLDEIAQLKAERDEARTKLNWINNLTPWYHPQTGELYYHEKDVMHVLNHQPKEQGKNK